MPYHLKEDYSLTRKKFCSSQASYFFNAQDIVQSFYMKEVSAAQIKETNLALKNESFHKLFFSAEILKLNVCIRTVCKKKCTSTPLFWSLKKAVVLPTHIAGFNADINQQPVPVLPLLGKKLEGMIFKRPYDFLLRTNYF